MANEALERIKSQMLALLERAHEAGWDDGRHAGRHEAVEQLRYFFENFGDGFTREPGARKRTPRAAGHMAPGVATAAVRTALAELEAANPEGADPHAVADHLVGQGIEINVPQTRQALRQLTLTGAARRVSRGRYLPGEASDETPQIGAAAE